ncbi:hypothetical protein WMY93_001741 [Mugilogobius chulae]|uniref:Uncharacterized protein n=1 Tax=Mugilogobius chulae TaxID=88201 RepID=A0AAW0PTW5_9GOBI
MAAPVCLSVSSISFRSSTGGSVTRQVQGQSHSPEPQGAETGAWSLPGIIQGWIILCSVSAVAVISRGILMKLKGPLAAHLPCTCRFRLSLHGLNYEAGRPLVPQTHHELNTRHINSTLFVCWALMLSDTAAAAGSGRVSHVKYVQRKVTEALNNCS